MSPLSWAGGIFSGFHKELMGKPIDFHAFQIHDHDPKLIQEARLAWDVRVKSEFISIQVMTRFLQEVLCAGDPLDVYAGAAAAVQDEIRHTALCAGMLGALGGQPTLPNPLYQAEEEDFLRLPMAQRATADAISMLAISETLSTGFIQDLQSRCTDPIVGAVLDQTLEDEDDHEEFGWAYIKASLMRFEGGLPYFQHLVVHTLEPHITHYQPILTAIPLQKRKITAFPELERARLGLLSAEREALIFVQTLRNEVLPRLTELGLFAPEHTQSAVITDFLRSISDGAG